MILDKKANGQDSGLTQFISHPDLAGWEFKRFYRYREGLLDGCVSDRCRRLMNWYKKEFLHIFLQSVGMRQKNNHPQTWPRQTRYLQMMNRSSGHQNQLIHKTGIKKFFLEISGPQQRWPRPLSRGHPHTPSSAGGRWFRRCRYVCINLWRIRSGKARKEGGLGPQDQSNSRKGPDKKATQARQKGLGLQHPDRLGSRSGSQWRYYHAQLFWHLGAGWKNSWGRSGSGCRLKLLIDSKQESTWSDEYSYIKLAKGKITLCFVDTSVILRMHLPKYLD